MPGKYSLIHVFCLICTAVSGFESVPLHEIHSGMKCHGYSCFSDNTLEKIDIEIIGVVEGTTRDTSLILARVDSPAVRRGGIMSGMSGSPVYYGDRLVGAMSMAFPFATEPICGITPISAMDRLEELAAAPGRGPAQRPRRNDLYPVSEKRSLTGLKPIGLSLDIRGAPDVAELFPESVFVPARAPFQGFQEQRMTSDTYEPPELVPGSPVGVGLVSGDVTITAYGTVTDVRDNTVLAFGHSMFGLGQCRLPLHASEVVSFIPTLYVSFKLANSGPPIGTITFDSEAGILAELGQIPPVIPVTLTIEGFTPEPLTYKIVVADNDHLTTVLIVQSLYGLINNLGGLFGDLSMDLELAATLTNGLSIHLSDCYGSVTQLYQEIHNSLKTIETIHQNPLETVSFTSISIRCRLAETTRLATLDTISVANRPYRPGDTIRIQMLFHGDRMESFSRTVHLPVPEYLVPGRYVLKVLDAQYYARDAAAKRLPAHQYDSFEKWFHTLSDRISGNQVMAVLTAGGTDIQAHGSILPSAPPVLQGLLAMPGLDHRVVGSSRVLSSETLTLDVQVVGGKQLPVYIDVIPETRK